MLKRILIPALTNRPVSSIATQTFGRGIPIFMIHRMEAPGQSIMGIRPEHLQITPAGWALQVETLEMLGAERLVYCRMGGEPLIVRTDEGQVAPAIGATIHVTPRFDRLHWFDAASGQRL